MRLLLALALTSAAYAQPAILAEGGLIRDSLTVESPVLGSGEFAAGYALDISENGPFEVILSSGGFDTYLMVLSPAGDRYENDDWDGGPSESRVWVERSEVGTWQILVTSYSPGETGAYTLAHRRLSAEAFVQRRALVRSDSLLVEARALFADGQYAAAESRARQALTIREDVLPEMHPDLAEVLNDLGAMGAEQSKPETARPLLERALWIYESALGPSHPEVAKTASNLAVVVSDLGDHSAALALYERALAIREATLDPDHPDVVRLLNNVATTLVRVGRYRDARSFLERSLALRESAFGPDHPETATALANLAYLIQEQGDLDRAVVLHERALAIREATLGADDPLVALVLVNLASVRERQGNDDEALALLERARAIYEASLGPNHPDLARTLNNLGAVQAGLGRYEDAERLHDRALSIYQEAYGPTHPEVATSLNNVAYLRYRRGDAGAAQAFHERALAIREQVFGREHVSVGVSLRNLAAALAEQDSLPAARSAYRRAASIYDGLVAGVLPTLSEAEQRAFVGRDLGSLTSALLSYHRGQPEFGEAYAFVGGWKGLLLRELRRNVALYAETGDPERDEQVRQLRALRAQIAHAYGSGGAALAQLTEAKERLERRLAPAATTGEDLWAQYGAEGLRRHLPVGGVFVDVYRFVDWARGDSARWRYGAVVVSRSAPPAFFDLGAASDLDHALEDWRDRVRRGQIPTRGGMLWPQLAVALPPGTRQVWVSPDGSLSRAPWAALADAQAAAFEGGEAPLVAQVPSARALLTLLTSSEIRDQAGEMLLVGDVNFGDGTAWTPLPGTAREVEALSGVAAEAGVATHVLRDGTPTAAVVTEALPQATFAHLATHGFFYRAPPVADMPGRAGLDLDLAPEGDPAVASRNPLAESGLALAGANGGPEGLLTAEELVGLDLSGTRLVTLSACETGRGTEVAGQGVLGLQASLTAAGARTVLMSLWAVPDASTAALMEAFYKGLWQQTRSPAEALAQAQAEVRGTPGWEAPLHWAAWVLTGDAFTPVE